MSKIKCSYKYEIIVDFFVASWTPGIWGTKSTVYVQSSEAHLSFLDLMGETVVFFTLMKIPAYDSRQITCGDVITL